MANVLMAITTLLLPMLTTAALWCAAWKRANTRRFLVPLAAGWTIGVIGNLTWGIYNMVSDNALPALSFSDTLFALRDALHLVAFLRLTSARMTWRQTAILGSGVPIALVAILGGYVGLEAAGLPVSADYWGELSTRCWR
jgi:hypothetical protein